MHTVQTVLIFAGIPAAVIAVVTGVIYAGSGGSRRRYRPGRPFEFAPVWFLSAPEGAGDGRTVDADHAGAPAVGGADRAALPAGAPVPEAPPAAGSGEWPVGDPAQRQATGGASDRW